jgi:hypothetical protein
MDPFRLASAPIVHSRRAHRSQDALRLPPLALLELQSQVRALSNIGSLRQQSIREQKALYWGAVSGSDHLILQLP